MSTTLPAQLTIVRLTVVIVCFIVCFGVKKNWIHLGRPSLSHGSIEGNQMRVLVTGAAGFIGFHLAKDLSKNPETRVVGIDNFNDYYDVQLKIDRAYELHRAGVKMYHADLCDDIFLYKLFDEEHFTHVVHLGAQAGVRYSLDHPLVYVRSNIQGHQSLLDVIKQFENIHLVYASSSSVYGKNSSIPFRLSANTDNPGNMYAASKRANELMSYQHCAETGMRNVGLRFFTVYGPWGRPDMAVYRFAESILEGQKVPMFHISDDKPLGRDFTYIDDIIAGVVNAMSYQPAGCGAIFNLGYGHPVSVPQLIKILETELDTQAQVEKLPLPPTEILQTWADTDVSKDQLDFRPKIDLVAGVREFVSWFKDYRDRRQQQRNGSGASVDARVWYNELIASHPNKMNSVHSSW